MSEQRRYQIVIGGKPSFEQIAWFPELEQSQDDDQNTVLSGNLPDQSALIGILFRAHNMNLRILAVEVKVNE